MESVGKIVFDFDAEIERETPQLSFRDWIQGTNDKFFEIDTENNCQLLSNRHKYQNIWYIKDFIYIVIKMHNVKSCLAGISFR